MFLGTKSKLGIALVLLISLTCNTTTVRAEADFTKVAVIGTASILAFFTGFYGTAHVIKHMHTFNDTPGTSTGSSVLVNTGSGTVDGSNQGHRLTPQEVKEMIPGSQYVNQIAPVVVGLATSLLTGVGLNYLWNKYNSLETRADRFATKHFDF